MSRYPLRKDTDDGDEGAGAPDTPKEGNVDPSDELGQDVIDDLIGFTTDDEDDTSPSDDQPQEEEEVSDADVEAEEEAVIVEDDPAPDDSQEEEVKEPAPKVEEPKAEEEEEQKLEEVPKQPTPEEIAKAKQTWVSELEKGYQLSDEDADMMVSEPEKVLPKLAANMHSQIVGNVIKAVSDMLPGAVANIVQQQPDLIGNVVQTHATAESRKEQFFKDFPELKGKEANLAPIAELVKQQFPDMSLDDQMKQVGSVAMTMLGLTPKAPKAAPKPAAKKQTPFTPAAAGGASGDANPGRDPQEEIWSEFID